MRGFLSLTKSLTRRPLLTLLTLRSSRNAINSGTFPFSSKSHLLLVSRQFSKTFDTVHSEVPPTEEELKAKIISLQERIQSMTSTLNSYKLDQFQQIANQTYRNLPNAATLSKLPTDSMKTFTDSASYVAKGVRNSVSSFGNMFSNNQSFTNLPSMPKIPTIDFKQVGSTLHSTSSQLLKQSANAVKVDKTSLQKLGQDIKELKNEYAYVMKYAKLLKYVAGPGGVAIVSILEDIEGYLDMLGFFIDSLEQLG
jgi:hypothetical protein